MELLQVEELGYPWRLLTSASSLISAETQLEVLILLF